MKWMTGDKAKDVFLGPNDVVSEKSNYVIGECAGELDATDIVHTHNAAIAAQAAQIKKLREVLIECEAELTEYFEMTKPPVRSRVGRVLKEARAALAETAKEDGDGDATPQT